MAKPAAEQTRSRVIHGVSCACGGRPWQPGRRSMRLPTSTCEPRATAPRARVGAATRPRRYVAADEDATGGAHVAIIHEEFWALIDEARARRTGPLANHTVEALEAMFAAADERVVLGFERWLRAYNEALLNRADLRATCELVLYDDGAETFAMFRGWLLAQGRDAVSLALRDLDALADFATDPIQPCSGMLSVAANRLGVSGSLASSPPLPSIPGCEAWSADWSDSEPTAPARVKRATARARLPRLAAKGDA